jgi:hypothetical protein
MSITLATLTIPDNTVLRGLDANTVSVSVERSDEGVALPLVAVLDGGRELTLYGWFERQLEQQLLDIAKSGTPQQLDHPLYSGTVLITGTDMEDWFEYVNPDPDDIRVGEINLLEII